MDVSDTTLHKSSFLRTCIPLPCYHPQDYRQSLSVLTQSPSPGHSGWVQRQSPGISQYHQRLSLYFSNWSQERVSHIVVKGHFPPVLLMSMFLLCREILSAVRADKADKWKGAQPIAKRNFGVSGVPAAVLRPHCSPAHLLICFLTLSWNP